jgi:hypothetical protein
MLLLVFVLAGCTGPAARVGRSSFEVLGSPDNHLPSHSAGGHAEETGERVDFITAYARGPLAKPIYPAAALKHGAGQHVVFVTVTIDEFGRVSEVVPSWQRIQLGGPFAEDFFAAAKAAVEQWVLSPAHQVYYRKMRGADDEYLRTEAVAQTFEVKFVFEAPEAVQ